MSSVWTSFLSAAHLHICLPSLIVAYCLGWVIYSRYFHPLAKYPGPFFASISRLWLIIDVAKGNAEKTQRQLHARFGSIVRIAPDEIAIADPEAIKVIYAIHSGFTKTDFYVPFRAAWGRYPDLFTNLDEKQHAQRRRIVNNVYSMSNIIQMEKRIDDCVEVIVQKFTECAAKGSAIDMAAWAKWYAFDIIGELFFSSMFGFMKGAHDHEGYIEALNLLLPFNTLTCILPAYMRSIFRLGSTILPRASKAFKAAKHLENAADMCIAERQGFLDSGDIERKDMLQSFIDIMHEKGEAKDFGETEVKVEVFGALVAGSDTTAIAITSILYHLMRTPSAYKKLTAEIDQATEAGFLSSPVVQYHEAMGLSYLDACCKEGMRLHPSIALTLPRHVPRDGRVIAGEWFPEGTRVGVNAAVVQRDKSVFGEDADEFVPERWLDENAVRMERYLLHFGTGSRSCIGKNISLSEIYKLIPQLLRSFHLELLEPDKEWETQNHWFNKPSKVYTNVRRR
ncbi:cytochrome P450 [Pyrenochaeta sp. MPI-SDFR-AT-0127]|nr:cytochrome P450 [Pyrenochaeta sp. MPI-SDFR-AT-0127]